MCISYCSAAIEALRKELADLKLQMMRNVKHSDSVPRTPSLHSHNSIPRSPSSHSHSTIKGPPSPTVTTSRLTSREYPSNSSQPKLLGREFSSYPSASNLPLHRIETPSSNHALTNGRRSSQMTTTSLITNSIHANVLSSQNTLTNGGRSSPMSTTTLTTNDINTDTPTHSSKSTTSPTHTYSSRGSSTTAVTKVDLTPKSSPSTSRQPSSVRLSTPALSSYATLKSTPVPTPQHSVTGRTTSEASFHRPNSIASGRYNAGPRVPANGYASSSNASGHHVNQVPRYDSASDQYDNDSVRYHPSSQATSDATAPSTIRRMNARGSVNHYRPPTYEEAKMIPSYSNRATANSSFVVPSAISVPVEPSDTKGCATEIDPGVAGCTSDNGCPYCGDRDAQVSRNESRSSYGSTTHRQVYAPSNNTNHLHKQSQSHHSDEIRGARVDTANSLVQSDHDTGQRPYVGSVSASSVMSFNGAQTPMATSTPSRRNAVLNSRHIHAQAPYYARDKLSERFRTSRDSSEGENTRGAGIPTSSNIPTKSVASNKNTFPRYSSTAASRSPPNEGKRLSEDYTIYSTHSSPVHSCASGYSSGVSSSAQSSPGRGYSNTRRASSPALYTTAHKKSYREQIVKKPSRVRHSDNNIGGYSEDSSSDNGEERYLDRYQDAYTSSEGHGEACATRDNRTPHVHVHVPTSARRVSIRRRKPPPYRDDHYSDTETSPEHLYRGHTKPRVVRVVKTPKLRKKQVVYLASQDPPPEEIYYSESGSGLFTPRQASHGRRVVGVVERRNGRSVSRGEGVRVAELRGSRPRKVYVEQPSEPVKRVYIVEQESESDLEQFEAIEVSRSMGSKVDAHLVTCDLGLK